LPGAADYLEIGDVALTSTGEGVYAGRLDGVSLGSHLVVLHVGCELAGGEVITREASAVFAARPKTLWRSESAFDDEAHREPDTTEGVAGVLDEQGDGPPLAVQSPARGRVTLEVRVPNGGLGRIAIFDVRGRLVDEWTGPWKPGLQRVEWSGGGSGVYFARLEIGGVARTTKFVYWR
jgi:hypothetical protein